ncbi:MAG: hypothetical protein RLZZ436_1207 [Planctomycetota bacterium]
MGTGLSSLRWLCVISVVVNAASVEAGVVAVNWSGNYVSSTQSFDPGIDPPPPGGVDSYEDPNPYEPEGGPSWYYGRLVSDSTPYSPPSIVPQPGSNPTFYGGHVVQTAPPNGSGGNGGNEGMSNLWIVDNTQGDYIHVDVNPANALQKFGMLTYWKLPDGGTKYKLDSASKFELTSTQDAGPKPAGHSLRWVIRNKSGVGEKFYVSDLMNFANAGVYSTVLQPSILTSDWYEYDPRVYSSPIVPPDSDLQSILFQSKGLESPSSFTDITAVGFYVEYNHTTNGAGEVHYKISSFSATIDPNGNAVPEPSTFLLGLVGAGGVAFRRWRQRRNSSVAELSAAADLSC